MDFEAFSHVNWFRSCFGSVSVGLGAFQLLLGTKAKVETVLLKYFKSSFDFPW